MVMVIVGEMSEIARRDSSLGFNYGSWLTTAWIVLVVVQWVNGLRTRAARGMGSFVKKEFEDQGDE